MRTAPIWLLALAICELFAFCGSSTESGRRAFDEMAGAACRFS
jgi:hypothetical protein